MPPLGFGSASKGKPNCDLIGGGEVSTAFVNPFGMFIGKGLVIFPFAPVKCKPPVALGVVDEIISPESKAIEPRESL